MKSGVYSYFYETNLEVNIEKKNPLFSANQEVNIDKIKTDLALDDPELDCDCFVNISNGLTQIS